MSNHTREFCSLLAVPKGEMPQFTQDRLRGLHELDRENTVLVGEGEHLALVMKAPVTLRLPVDGMRKYIVADYYMVFSLFETGAVQFLEEDPFGLCGSGFRERAQESRQSFLAALGRVNADGQSVRKKDDPCGFFTRKSTYYLLRSLNLPSSEDDFSCGTSYYPDLPELQGHYVTLDAGDWKKLVS